MSHHSSPLSFSQSMCDLSNVHCFNDLRRASVASRRRPLSSRSKSEDSLSFKTISQPQIPTLAESSSKPDSLRNDMLKCKQTAVDIHASSPKPTVSKVDIQTMEENLAAVCKVIEKTGDSDCTDPEEEVFITSNRDKIRMKGNG